MPQAAPASTTPSRGSLRAYRRALRDLAAAAEAQRALVLAVR